MMTQVCETLRIRQDDLHKDSIYLLNTDEQDRDFEFFVLVDPGDEDARCEFLQELFQILIVDETQFYESAHKSKLQEWLGTSEEKDRDLTPLNWLKVKIEHYPYRLFVVIDPQQWQKNGQSVFEAGFWRQAPVFLKKRICWISKTDFQKKLEQVGDELERLRFWLMQQWLVHICSNLLGCEPNKSGHLVLYFNQLYEGNDEFHRPTTLPSVLAIGIDQKQIEKRAEAFDKIYRLNLFEGRDIEKIDDDAIAPDDHILFFSRHRNFFELVDNSKNKQQRSNRRSTPVFSAGSFDDYKPQLIYSESLSGSLSHFLRIVMALERDHDTSSRFFLLQLIEQSLLRIAIVDERIQEKYAQLDHGRAAGIFQSCLLVSYLGEPGRYGQKPRPMDRPFGKFPVRIFQPQKSDGKDFTIPNIARFELLWPERHRGIDAIIIHQGILDKWKQGENYTRRMLALKDKIPFVIITSGRGIPSNLPQGIKFLPFSGLETCFVGNYFEKLTLVRQIFSLI